MSQMKRLATSTTSTSKKEAKEDEDFINVKIRPECYFTNGLVRKREGEDEMVLNIGLKSGIITDINMKDQINATLVFDDYLTNTTSSAFYASIAPQVTSCHSWSLLSAMYREYKVNSITVVFDLAKPGERNGSYATGRPTMLFTYTSNACTTFQAALDTKHVKWLDPCPGHYIVKHTQKAPPLYVSTQDITSGVQMQGKFMQVSQAGYAHNGFFTIIHNEAMDVAVGFPIAWYFDITFRGRQTI